MENFKIAIISTVINFDLYAKSSQLFPKNIPKYVIDGTNGMHGLDSLFYMMKKLKGKEIEWLIMADEDVLIYDSAVICDIIQKMQSEDYMICGIRDGGIITHRIYNPFVINTFFSIINFKELERVWDKKQITKNNFIRINEFDDDLTNLQGKYDENSLYEPYYCFYLWLRRKNKRFLFLDGYMSEDQITNSVFYKDKLLLYHTWFARAYGINKKHTNRIDKIFELTNFQNNKTYEARIFKDKSFFLIKKMKKMYQRIIRKINLY